jgi:hypothetical protein
MQFPVEEVRGVSRHPLRWLKVGADVDWKVTIAFTVCTTQLVRMDRGVVAQIVQ